MPNLTSLLLNPPLIRSPDVRGLRADATVLEAASWKGPASARSVLCSLLPVLTLHFLLILSALPVLTTWGHEALYLLPDLPKLHCELGMLVNRLFLHILTHIDNIDPGLRESRVDSP